MIIYSSTHRSNKYLIKYINSYLFKSIFISTDDYNITIILIFNILKIYLIKYLNTSGLNCKVIEFNKNLFN